MPVGAPVPVFVIAYVARDDRAQRGLGSALVVDAARRARTLYPTWGLMLFARNARLVKFYEELGFKVIRSLKREREAAEGLKGEGPFQMYAPHEALIIE
jgi:ribosomal protein S18 acetylase RimI-like enzyme